MSTTPICLVDMDGTAVDIYKGLIKEYNARFLSNIKFSEVPHLFGDHTISEYGKARGFTREIVDEIFSSSGFFLNLSLFPGAKEAIQKLQTKLDVVFVSTPYLPGYRPYLDKYEWIKNNFPGLEEKFIATAHKEYVMGDVLIDDHVENLTTWKNSNIYGWTASLKYDWINDENCEIYADNWTDLADMILDKFKGEN